MKKNHPLKVVFYALLGIFTILLVFILTPLQFIIRERSEIISQVYLFFFYGFAIAVFVLGIVLIILTIKAKVKGRQKFYLLLTGSSPLILVIFAILHNFFDAFAQTSAGVLSTFFEVLAVTSFFISVFSAPILFIVGVVGSIVHFRKKKKK